MTLTVRHRAQLLAAGTTEVLDDVTAVAWFEADEVTGAWGGIVEPLHHAADIRARVSAGETEYDLCLDDGRSGTVVLQLSEFVADGAAPLVYRGAGPLARPHGGGPLG